MAELADALDLGSSVSRRAGSSPVIRIVLKKWETPVYGASHGFCLQKNKPVFWLHLVTLIVATLSLSIECVLPNQKCHTHSNSRWSVYQRARTVFG